VATGYVSKAVTGVSPRFNSLDPANGLALGSAIITDLTTLSLVVDNLDQGIAYYFRASAINSVGQGPYGFAAVPYAIPEPLQPGPPLDVSLSVVDSTSLEVSFNPPSLDGGEDISYYRVEYANKAFVTEVQQVSLLCNVTHQEQVISSSTSNTPEVQLVYIRTSFKGTSISEVQFVQCDATGGSFRLSLYGYVSPSILYSADASTVKAALEEIEIINSVSVTFVNGAVTACFANALHPTGGFQVNFTSIVGHAGDIALMSAYTNNLLGLRRIDISERVAGDAGIGGTFRLSFRGFVTADIPATATAAELTTALTDLDSIPSSGVTVNLVPSASLTNSHSRQWQVTFSSADLGGDVS